MVLNLANTITQEPNYCRLLKDQSCLHHAHHRSRIYPHGPADPHGTIPQQVTLIPMFLDPRQCTIVPAATSATPSTSHVMSPLELVMWNRILKPIPNYPNCSSIGVSGLGFCQRNYLVWILVYWVWDLYVLNRIIKTNIHKPSYNSPSSSCPDLGPQHQRHMNIWPQALT